MFPTAEKRCFHCGETIGNELSWKIPLIIGLFVAAFVIAVAVQIIAR
jgi:hypothetical protein